MSRYVQRESDAITKKQKEREHEREDDFKHSCVWRETRATTLNKYHRFNLHSVFMLTKIIAVIKDDDGGK